MRFAGRGNAAYFELADGNPAMSAVKMRVHARAGFKLEDARARFESPNAGEGGTQVLHQQFCTMLDHLGQLITAGEGAGDIGSQGGHACAVGELAAQTGLPGEIENDSGHMPAVSGNSQSPAARSHPGATLIGMGYPVLNIEVAATISDAPQHCLGGRPIFRMDTFQELGKG
jgi:hypothetical protein